MNITELLPCDALETVTVHRPGEQTAGAGGKPVEVTTKIGSFTMQVTKLSGGQAHRAFGDRSKATWRAQADSDADVLKDDLVVIDTGAYAGTVLEIDDVRVPGGALKVLALAITDRQVD